MDSNRNEKSHRSQNEANQHMGLCNATNQPIDSKLKIKKIQTGIAIDSSRNADYFYVTYINTLPLQFQL